MTFELMQNPNARRNFMNVLSYLDNLANDVNGCVRVLCYP